MPYSAPFVEEPTKEDIRRSARTHNIELTDDEVDAIKEYSSEMISALESVDELQEPRPPRSEYTDRDPGYTPGREEDPLNLFITKCRVEGSDEGPLSGYEVGIKDCVSVAGVEMTLGSKTFRGYTPQVDATVVSRLLEDGATITGKMNMDEFGGAGSGEHAGIKGPIINPKTEEHLPGGSSGGATAAVAAGEVDVAIGGDQAGSIRIPASWCGVVGLKPTHGLVPYTGAVGWGHTIDHLGPIAKTAADCARVLDSIAGYDPLDPRQHEFEPDNYAADLGIEPEELTIGVLEEGHDRENSNPAVDQTVAETVEEFERRGATVVDVSVPLHLHGPDIWLATVMGASDVLFKTDGMGRFAKGYYDTNLAAAFGANRRTKSSDWTFPVKTQMTIAAYVSDRYMSHFYAKSQNIRRKLDAQFEAVFNDVDIIVMPTMPDTAIERVYEDVPYLESLHRAWNYLTNTPSTDLTGHPALTAPCGSVEGLPVGIEIIAPKWEDKTALSVAHTLEQFE